MLAGKRWRSPARPFCLPARLSAFCVATQLLWGEGGLSISSWKQITQRKVSLVFTTSPPHYSQSHSGTSAPCFSECWGAADAPSSQPPGPPSIPRGTEAPSSVLSPRSGSQGLTHCARQPSQRLLASHRAEPANGRGDVSTSHCRNEAATPAPAEAGAWDEKWPLCALPRIKLFRGSQVPVCHGDGRVINAFGRTTTRWL